MTPGQALSLFLRSAAAAVLTVLLVAQGMDWANADLLQNVNVIGWSLVTALLVAIVAVGHAYITSPAATPLGKAFRQGVQVLVMSPVAAFVFSQATDAVEFMDALVPVLILAFIAFLISLLGNYAPTPVAPQRTISAGSDFTKGYKAAA